MAESQRSYPSRSEAATATSRVNRWVKGLTVFAGVMMIVIGGSHILAGVAAVREDTFYVVRDDYALEFDVTAWGWVQIIGGAFVVVAGAALFTGSPWARVVAIVLASISALWSFFSIPYYTVWSIVIIALDVAVIWALLTTTETPAQEEVQARYIADELLRLNDLRDKGTISGEQYDRERARLLGA